MNLVHNLFLVYLSISTCFGRLSAHHQGKQLFFFATLGTCYSVWMTVWYAGSNETCMNDISTRHAVGLYWVPGHAGVRRNEIADKLARSGSLQRFVGPELF